MTTNPIVYSTSTTHARGMASVRTGIGTVARASFAGVVTTDEAIAQAQARNARPVPPVTPVFGMCRSCGAVEVRLNQPVGTTDLSRIGESAAYPFGFGCEACD
jgi:hypothetical protein